MELKLKTVYDCFFCLLESIKIHDETQNISNQGSGLSFYIIMLAAQASLPAIAPLADHFPLARLIMHRTQSRKTHKANSSDLGFNIDVEAGIVVTLSSVPSSRSFTSKPCISNCVTGTAKSNNTRLLFLYVYSSPTLRLEPLNGFTTSSDNPANRRWWHMPSPNSQN